MTYLDYNATTCPLAAVREAMQSCLSNCWGNASSAHSVGQRSRELVENAREHVAALIGASPGEIVFTSGATESNQTVLRTFLDAGLSVATSAVEHQSVLSVLEERSGGQERALISVGSEGTVDCTELLTRMGTTEQPGLVSLIWANNETGILSPVERVAEIVSQAEWRLHLDGAQMVGKLPVDVSALNVDYLSLSAHKIYGPQGIGALYVRNGAPYAPLLSGTQERGRRGGTEPVALVAGFGEAAKLAAQQMAEREAGVRELRDHLEAELLGQFDGAVINGAAVERLPNTSSVTFPGVDAEVLTALLSDREIYVSTGSACKSSAPTPSHVLLAMGLAYSDAAATLRISLSHLNTDKDISAVLQGLQEAVPMLRE